MKQNFTPNDLLRFLYKETSLSETVALKEAIEENDNLHDEYQALLKAYHTLPKVKFRPTPDAVRNILNYSAKTAVEQQH
ncbi:MAG TPA: hypothetical protein PKC40_00575 [Saprospiraceae bacterium]|nr:hypothetical protein [Saprospiraceae bacterium]